MMIFMWWDLPNCATNLALIAVSLLTLRQSVALHDLRMHLGVESIEVMGS